MRVTTFDAFDDDKIWRAEIESDDLFDLVWVPHAFVNSLGHKLGKTFVIIYRDIPVGYATMQAGTEAPATMPTFKSTQGLEVSSTSRYAVTGISGKHLLVVDGIKEDRGGFRALAIEGLEVVIRPNDDRGTIHLELGENKKGIAFFLHGLIANRTPFLSFLNGLPKRCQKLEAGRWVDDPGRAEANMDLSFCDPLTVFYEGSMDEIKGCITAVYSLETRGATTVMQLGMIGAKRN